MKIRIVAAVAALVFSGTGRTNGQIVLVRDFSDISTLETSTDLGSSPPPNLNIRQYSSTDRTGGGQFILDSSGCTSDHGVLLNDTHTPTHNCYRRQFSGPVHLPWYGVKDAANDSTCLSSTTIASCDAHGVLIKAFDASKAFGDGGVVTDGRSIVLDGNIDINEKQYLSCNGPPGGSRDQSYSGSTNYYTLPNSLVLNPAHSIRRHANSRLSECIIRPYWYLQHTSPPYIPPQSVADTVQMMHQFTGTATTCDGEACNMDNMLIIGFDTCDETTKQRSILSNLLEECMVNEWIHDNGGGMKLQNIIVKQYIEGSLPAGYDHANWPITSVRLDTGTDRIIATIYAPMSNPNALDTMNYGDTVLISGMGESHTVNTTGTLTNGADTITEVPAADVSKIGISDVVQDNGGSGCVPANTFVETVDPADDGTYTVTASGPMSCSAANEALIFAHFLGPAGANGRWLTANVSSGGTDLWDVKLVGASWAGPTTDMNTVTWKAGSPVIGVMDTTNIVPGQYVCTISTATPFCSAPGGFSSSYVVTNISSITNTTGTITVNAGASPPAGVTGWPVSGLVRVVNEDMAYTLLSGSQIKITARGLNGTTAVTHLDTDHIVPAAPVVVGVVPTSKSVVVSAAAQSSCLASCGSVTFANDTRTSSSGYIGQLTLNPGYHTWTANTAAGPNPSGVLIALGTRLSTDPAHQLTLGKNGWKIQPGMKVADLTTPANISNGASVSVVSGNVVTLQTADTVAAFMNDKIQFTGCGMPDSTHPWLGNCASTSLLAGGGNDLAQGVVCEYFHSFGNQIQFHTIDAPATSCTNSVLAGGGGLGDQIDPDSVALWLDGDATKTQFTNGRIAGATTSILDTPDKNGNGGGQADGVGLSNIQIPGNVVLGPDSNALLIGVHGHPSGAQSNPFIYAASAMLSTQISGSYLPQWPIYFDDTSVLPKIFCSGNDFATPLCGQTKTTPSCTSGCAHSTDVSGNDGDFDVTTNGTATSITVTLAANYPAKPICRASTSTTSSGTAASAAISLVTLLPFGTTVTFKTSPAVPHIYGSCHSATG